MYEMAWKYPFLYKPEMFSKEIYTECIEAALYSNYFIHFAGRWEGDAWKKNTFSAYQNNLEIYSGLNEYTKVIPTGIPKGVIHPVK